MIETSRLDPSILENRDLSGTEMGSVGFIVYEIVSWVLFTLKDFFLTSPGWLEQKGTV